MLGSSPDVVMTVDEWHVAVFGDRHAVRKGATQAFSSLGLKSFEPLRRYALRKTLEARDPDDLAAKPDARACVVKLMGYHLVFSEMIRRSFEQATFVNLVRHPYGQCESLLRSGQTLEVACRRYNDVSEMILERSASGAITVRFEDVVTHPVETCDELYRSLGIRWADDGRFAFKIKPYGANRVGDVDVSRGEIVRLGADDAGDSIDPSVLHGERERLTEAQRRSIWALTGPVAARLGYTESGSC
jgi:hypothetical protein